MTRDYKNTRVRDHGRLPGWLLFVAGLTVGLGVAAMVYFNTGLAPQLALQPDPTPPRDARDVRRPEAEAIPSPARRFDFYTMLPELEVVVPEAEPPAAHGQSAAPTQSLPAAGGYVLQAGSFKQFEQADSFKARLALLGIQADIHSVRVNNDTWHRVRLGPYEDLERANDIRARLADKEIDTLLLRVRE